MPYKDKEKYKEYVANYNKELRRFCIERGICVICHKEKAEDGYKTCLACRMEENERIRERNQEIKTESNEEYKSYIKKQTEKSKQRRLALEQAGLCNACGKRKPSDGKKRCDFCLAKYNNAKKRKKERERLENGLVPCDMFGQQGYCSMCGKPVMDGKRLCQHHYERAMIGCKAMREANKAINATKVHKWSEDNKLLFPKRLYKA